MAVALVLGSCRHSALGAEAARQYRWLRRTSAEGPIVWTFRASRRGYVRAQRAILGEFACDSPPLQPSAVGAAKRAVGSVLLRWIPNLPNDLTREVYELQISPVLEEVFGDGGRGGGGSGGGNGSDSTDGSGIDSGAAAPSAAWVNACSKVTSTEYTIAGLRGGELYRIRVRAANARGTSPWRECTFRTKLDAVEGGARGPLLRHPALLAEQPPVRSYSWTQLTNKPELVIRLRLPAGTRGRAIAVEVQPTKLQVCLAAATPPARASAPACHVGKNKTCPAPSPHGTCF